MLYVLKKTIGYTLQAHTEDIVNIISTWNQHRLVDYQQCRGLEVCEKKTCKMYVLHTDYHLRLSINLEAPPAKFSDTALPLVQLEGPGRDQSEYLSVIGREARGSCKFRRYVPNSQIGWEYSELSAVSVGSEVKRRTRVRISCM